MPKEWTFPPCLPDQLASIEDHRRALVIMPPTCGTLPTTYPPAVPATLPNSNQKQQQRVAAAAAAAAAAPHPLPPSSAPSPPHSLPAPNRFRVVLLASPRWELGIFFFRKLRAVTQPHVTYWILRPTGVILLLRLLSLSLSGFLISASPIYIASLPDSFSIHSPHHN